MDQIIRLKDLPAYCGLKRTQIDHLISRGEFPEPIKLNDTGRAKGWLSSEIERWQRSRIAKRDALVRAIRSAADV